MSNHSTKLRDLAAGVRMGHCPDVRLLAQRMDAIAAAMDDAQPAAAQHLTEASVAALKERLRADPEFALATLQTAGIATADGKLSEQYGGPAPSVHQHTMNNIDTLVSRFLSWRLPENFAPDAGVYFKPPSHMTSWPTGTNLLTAEQAKAMLQHVLGDVLAEAAKSERRAITFGDIVGQQTMAMRAAVVDAMMNGPDAGVAWIENTLEGPGHLPDLKAAKAEGGAQAMFNREMAEHEAFRAAHPAP